MNLRQLFTLLSLAAALAASYPATAESNLAVSQAYYKGYHDGSREVGASGLTALYIDNPFILELLRLRADRVASPRPSAPGLAELYKGNAHITGLLQLRETRSTDRFFGYRWPTRR